VFLEKRFNDKPWFYGFAFIHVIFWTILPTILRYCLPLDAIEGTTWGQHLALGYDKDPFLSAWLTELGVHLGGTSGWAIYGLSQLCIVIAFWAVWRLGRQLISPVYALIAVYLLEFISNYNLDTIDFDDNVLQVIFWALLIFVFYKALKNQKVVDWFCVGVFAALAFLSKYYVVFLFAIMGLFLIVNCDARKSFCHKGLYIASALFALLILPHIIWLYHHNWLTVRYLFDRSGQEMTLLALFKQPLYFAVSYLSAFILPSILFCVLYFSKSASSMIAEPRRLNYFQWQYLLWMGLGPFILTLIFSLETGSALHLGWGQPLMSFWGLILVAALQPRITLKRFYQFVIVGLIFLGILLGGYTYFMLHARNGSSANFPGQEVADQMTQLWHEHYTQPLKYVIGPRFEAGVVSFYSKDRPSVYIKAEPLISFWINDANIQKDGAIIIWNNTMDESPPSYTLLQSTYPNMIKPVTKKFYWKRTKSKKSFTWTVSMIPPKG